MTLPVPRQTKLQRRAAIAALVYVVALAGLVAASIAMVVGLVENARAVSAQSVLLDQISSRKAPVGASRPEARAPKGSPFLDGETITIAGAALQQRVTSAIDAVGGTVLSSQVDLEGPDAKAGAIRLVTTFEVSQSSLQKVLYDIEAGMPFLFIDSVTIEAPQGIGEQDSTPMRVSIGVEGRWLRAG